MKRLKAAVASERASGKRKSQVLAPQCPRFTRARRPQMVQISCVSSASQKCTATTETYPRAGLVAVVNNAGIGARVSLEQWLAEPSVGVEAARQFAVNYFGLLNVTQTLLPDLIEDAAEERCGSTRVINIGSLAGCVACTKRSVDLFVTSLKPAPCSNRQPRIFTAFAVHVDSILIL